LASEGLGLALYTWWWSSACQPSVWVVTVGPTRRSQGVCPPAPDGAGPPEAGRQSRLFPHRVWDQVRRVSRNNSREGLWRLLSTEATSTLALGQACLGDLCSTDHQLLLPQRRDPLWAPCSFGAISLPPCPQGIPSRFRPHYPPPQWQAQWLPVKSRSF
jgi:hypothetical protein